MIQVTWLRICAEAAESPAIPRASVASLLLPSPSPAPRSVTMRTLSALPALFAGALLVSSSAAAQDRPQVGAFGGDTFGSTTEATTFGGNIQTPLGSGLEIVGEFGQLEDVMPSTLGTLIDFTPVDLHLSAWYGEAGVRFTVPGHSSVRPYAEATGGFARMHTAFSNARRRCWRRVLGWPGDAGPRISLQADPGLRVAAVVAGRR